jgi:hypothetical protein
MYICQKPQIFKKISQNPISLNFRIIYKKTEREWRTLPKSYPVDKMRQ